MPYAIASGAAVLAWAYATDSIVPMRQGPMLALAALGFVLLAAAIRFKPYTLAMTILAAGGVWQGHALIAEYGAQYSGQDIAGALVTHIAFMVALFAALSEACRLARPCDGAVWPAVALPIGRETQIPLLPLAFALLAAEFFAMGALHYLPAEPRIYWFAAGALVAALYAHAAGAGGFGVSAIALTIALLIVGFYSIAQEISWGMAALALAPAFGTAFLGESYFVGKRPGTAALRNGPIPYMLYGIVAILLGLQIGVCYYEDNIRLCVLLLGFSYAVATLLALALHPRALSLWGVLFYVVAAALWHDMFLKPPETAWHILTLVLIATGFLGDRYHALRRALPLNLFGGALLIFASVLWFVYLNRVFRPDWFLPAWMLGSMGIAVYAVYFKSRTAAAIACVSAFGTLGLLLALSYPERQIAVTPMAAAYAAGILYTIVWERAYSLVMRRKPEWAGRIPDAVHPVLAAIPCITLVLALERVPAIHDFYLTIAWTIAAVAMFGLALATGVRYFRYAGLATFGLALLRVVFRDTRELDGIQRIAAYIVLGAVLLAVAYGYIYARNRGKLEETHKKP